MNNAVNKAARWLMLALPFALALVYSSACSPSFAIPKNTIFVGTAFALAALALLGSSPWHPVHGKSKRTAGGFSWELYCSALHQYGDNINVYNHIILFQLAFLNRHQLPFIG
jgi:hypothetical protein